MRTRDVAFVGLKLVAILIAREAVFPLAQVFGSQAAPTWTVIAYLVRFGLYLGIGYALWANAGKLADSMAGGEVAAATESRFALRPAVTAAAALLGLWILAVGISATINGIGAYISAGRIFSVSPLAPAGVPRFATANSIANPLRTQALWEIIAGAVEASIGAILIAMRATIANAIAPDAPSL